MSGGPEAIAQFQDDEEAMEILQNLGKVMGQS